MDHKGGLDKDYAVYIRNITFGVEDSLVSTVGLLAGIAVGGVSEKDIILTGVVLVLVEAFSMGIGSIVSEQSVKEYEARREVPLRTALPAGMVMFVAYIVAGLVPLAPYTFLSPGPALGVSIVLSLACLFLLGAYNAIAFGVRPVRSGVRMLVLGGIAVGLGIAAGRIFGA